ncbi:MAG: hypothetical protein J6Y78_09275 [Paludibacteraceae bacterium]|nr:hypothetical protein [Paludibacteraceae bacterium]
MANNKDKVSIPDRVKRFLFPEQDEDLFNQVQDYNNYANYALDTSMNTQSIIGTMKDVPSMLQDPICSSATKLIMQTAFQVDDKGKLFQLRSDNKLIKDELDRFHEKMGADNFVLTNGYNILLWGQLPWKHIYNSDGVLERVTPIPDFTSITPIVISGKTVGFINEEGNFVPSYEYTYAQMEYYRNLGGNTRNTYLTVGKNSDTEESFKNEFSYADSYLSSASKAWRNVNMIEDALMLNRLDQSNFFRIIAVNVGSQVYSKSAIQVLNYYRNLFKKVRRVSYDSDGMSSRGTGQEFDLIIPKTQNQGVEVTNVGGEVEVKAIRDLDNQYNKLFAALQIQPSMIGFSSDTPSSLGEGPTGSWDKRFARVCTAVSYSTYNALRNIDYLYLRSLGYNVDRDDWSYGYVSQTILEDQDKAELLKTSIENLKQLSEVLGRGGAEIENFNKTYLVKSTLGKALSTMGIDVEKLLSPSGDGDTKELIETSFKKNITGNFKMNILKEDLHVMALSGMMTETLGKEIVSAFAGTATSSSIISEKTNPIKLNQIRSNFAVRKDSIVNITDEVLYEPLISSMIEGNHKTEPSQALPFKFPVYSSEEMVITAEDLDSVVNHYLPTMYVDGNGNYLFNNKSDLCTYLKAYTDGCLDIYCGTVKKLKGLLCNSIMDK